MRPGNRLREPGGSGVTVALQVFDVAGRRVPGGLYFTRLSGEERSFTQRLVVLP